MRTVPGPVPGVVRPFIPSAFENRNDPIPVKVWIKQPTEDDKRKFDAATKLQLRMEGSEMRAVIPGGAELERWRDLVSKFVEKVENYSAPDGNAIDNGKKLAEHGETEFLKEIAHEIMTAASLSEQEKKA